MHCEAMLDSPELPSLGQHHLGINSFLTLGKEKRRFRDSTLERIIAVTVVPNRKRNFNYGAKELIGIASLLTFKNEIC